MIKTHSWAQVGNSAIDLAMALGVEAIFAFPVMWAWDCVVPVITKLPELGYWQVFSLMFLALTAKSYFRK